MFSEMVAGINIQRFVKNMSNKNNYVTKRQLKAVKSRGDRHSTTVTGNYWGLFPQRLPIGPVKGKKQVKEPEPTGPVKVENMTISIDLSVKNTSHHEDFIHKLISYVKLERVEKAFEVLSTAEKILRALAKAKFKNVAVIKLDGEVLYEHPEKFYDTKDAIKILIEQIHHQKQKGNNVFMELLSHEHKDCLIEVEVSRVHLELTHDIFIRFQGVLKEEYFRRIINYFEENLEIENIENDWKNA
jgi:hypothetical protein